MPPRRVPWSVVLVSALILAGVRGGTDAVALPLKIACIGDSITEGSGLSSAAIESYPARLQRLLGTNVATVRNFGVSGRTLLKKGDFPYWKESAYAQSRAWEPDVVTIKLGTNDSKPQNWRHGTNFVSELEEFIASYAAIASRPRIILCTPAPVFANGAFDIRPGIVATNIAPSIRELAGRSNLEVVDFHVRLDGHREWFPDTVHPNTRGMAVMAAILWQALTREAAPPVGTALEIAPISSGRAVLGWPAAGAGFVLQSASVPGGAPTTWTVVDQVAYTDGLRLRLTNRPTNPRFYRLWRP